MQFEIAKGGSSQSFEDWDGLIEYLRKEASYWDWLGGESTNPNGAGRSIRDQWSSMIQSANERKNCGSSLSEAHQIIGDLVSGNVPHHESEIGASILDIRSDVGETEAAWAAAFFTNRVSLEQVRSPVALRGVMLTAFPDARQSASIEKRLRQERANYRSSLKSAMSSAEAFQSECANNWRAVLERARGIGIRSLRRNRKRWVESGRMWRKQADDAVASIRETENTYTEFMQLRAPVDYWTGKSSEHGTEKSKAYENLRNYFIGLTLLLVAVFIAAGFLVVSMHDAANEPVALYVLISAGLAVLSTIGFWIGRILTKLYLSQHHLKTDADERATMIKTYLALTENGAASETDKQIILASLFRPTADGIVRDDGPPDLAFQSIAARMLSGKDQS
ncbi:DUF6161 domain-containing protein [Qipengyuania atrilutea]|uniref:DUF6161 domain-containing protein n=1 Tax=Qipengyuania atrilutea TaxID=2744473 RepID=A0A850H288_9SPHN|nr:DUF6161 domain-containing protein [Actirhodobacter atriluteus]NVD46134.1 hypothetical protein [Actirhodobacter atriluteus]